MKIVQSFWTKPFLNNGADAEGCRLNSGWPHRLLNYCSCALSCLLLLRQYKSVELYTDATGKEILIDKLKLPYTKVHVVLDEINHYPGKLWALGKLYTYSLQHEPFLHVDNDVFLFQPFDSVLMSKGLIAQNLEVEAGFYFKMVKQICRDFTYVPSFLQSQAQNQYIAYCNAGILGGQDIDFFSAYTQEVFKFLDSNLPLITHLMNENRIGDINVIYEQVIFYYYAEALKKRLNYFFPGAFYIPKGVGYFSEATRNRGYVHSLGFFKHDMPVYTLLELNLKEKFPEYYSRIKEMMAISEL